MILSSDSYGLVGDNSTDNATQITNWINAAVGYINSGTRVLMVLTPGNYRTSGSHNFPGEADVEFQAATLIRIGTDRSTPCFIHGRKDAATSGRLTGIAVDNFAGYDFYSPNHIGVRLLNKVGAIHEIAFVRGYTKAVQCQAYDIACAYNEVTLGTLYVCAIGVELNCATANTAFPSENKFNGGDVQSTSSFNNYGSCFGMVFSRDYETGGYTGHSGNFWYKPCFQVGEPAKDIIWSPGAALAEGTRYFTPKIGGEWLCARTGTAGTIEPSVIPAVLDKTNVQLTAGSAVAVMAGTVGISAGMHLRGSNPADAFPLNTYVASVDSATNITLTNPASRSSTNYHAILLPPTADNTATLIYLGPYRRSPVWLRSCGIANGVVDARWEGGTGEAVIVSGSQLFPQATPPDFALPTEFSATFHTQYSASVNNCNFPAWAHATYNAGDAVRPLVLGSQYWECIVGGTSGASEPTPPAGAPGRTFTDGSVTWLTRNIPDTRACGDWGEYLDRAGGGGDSWDISVGRPSEIATSTAKLDNLHLRAIGSAAGWLVRGAVKCVDPGVIVANFAPTDLSLARDALLINTTAAALGAVVKTNLLKCFSVRKYFSPSGYGYSRTWLVPMDASYNKLAAPPSAQAYHRRIQSWCYANSSGYYNESTDGPVLEFVALCNVEVQNVFVGIQRGSTGTPVACALTGLEIAEKAHRSGTQLQTHSVQFSTLQGGDHGPRKSLGQPTIGFFLSAGEYVLNASVTPGASAKGWFVTTAGILAPAWASGTAYVNGQLVTVGSNVYAANGAFTSGTAPAGTGTNILDPTAPPLSIVPGDVATWDFIAAVAVLVADEDTDTVLQAGATGATPAPDCRNGLTQVWTMNSNISVAAPSNPPRIGQTLTLVFVQDATGGRTIAWNAAYRNAPSWAAGAASRRAMAEFKYDGSSWQFVGGSSAFA